MGKASRNGVTWMMTSAPAVALTLINLCFPVCRVTGIPSERLEGALTDHSPPSLLPCFTSHLTFCHLYLCSNNCLNARGHDNGLTVRVCRWKSGDSIRCQSLPSALLEAGSCPCHHIRRASWLNSFPVSHLLIRNTALHDSLAVYGV